MNYQTRLIQIQNELIALANKANLESLLFGKFKNEYPGNYVLEWKFSPHTLKFEIYPIFENSKEETMWKLKYG